MFGAGDEIIEDILFFEFHASLMPFLAVFAAATEIGHDVNASHVEPGDGGRGVRRAERDVETTVGVEEGGIIFIQLQSFFMDDKHGNAGAIL